MLKPCSKRFSYNRHPKGEPFGGLDDATPEGLRTLYVPAGSTALVVVFITPEDPKHFPGTRFRSSLNIRIGRHFFRIGLRLR